MHVFLCVITSFAGCIYIMILSIQNQNKTFVLSTLVQNKLGINHFDQTVCLFTWMTYDLALSSNQKPKEIFVIFTLRAENHGFSSILLSS